MFRERRSEGRSVIVTGEGGGLAPSVATRAVELGAFVATGRSPAHIEPTSARERRGA
jgi:hypothetical protein